MRFCKKGSRVIDINKIYFEIQNPVLESSYSRGSVLYKPTSNLNNVAVIINRTIEMELLLKIQK